MKIIAADRRMEGGRLIGQGSYGCAFIPPLLCKSRQTHKFAKVGKLTDDDEAKHEIHIANRLRSISLVRNYILLPEPESCEPAPISKQKDKDIAQCDSTSRTNEYGIKWKDTHQLFLPYGGKNPLGNMIMAGSIHPKYFPFYPFMKHILEGGSLLVTSGICHYDLHPNNFLQDKYGVVRILDLGQAFDSREITQEVVTKRWKMLMFGSEKDAPNPMVTNSEPPEITILNAVRNGYTLEDAIRHVISGKTIFRDMERILGVSIEKITSELKDFFQTSQSAKEKNYVEFFKLYWPGFDAWSIGAILLHILKYQMTWIEFQQGEWQQKQKMTLLAIKSLLNPNPRKRLDCVEALFLFDPNNSWIQRFGKKWLQQRHTIREAAKKIE